MRRFVVSVVVMAAATILWSATAFADATPIELMLTYMPNVSNTGSSTASGIAELVMLEGEVRLSATDLPKLDGADRYVAWLVNTNTNQSFRLGSFNATEDTDSVHWEDVLPDAIPNKQWNLLLVTIESSSDPSRPSAKHSIAGTFPRTEHDPPPAVLPNTGGAPDDYVAPQPGFGSDRLSLAVLAALVASSSGAAGYVLGKRRARTGV
jgi:hypothetical protein